MDVADTDEATYAAILRSVFQYIKRIYAIDLDAKILATISASTANTVTIPYNNLLQVNQLITIGSDEVGITGIVDDLIAETSTITFSPAIVAPVVPSDISIRLLVVEYDLQYAIYQHAKYLLDSQKKNTAIISSVTDASGSKTTYTESPSKFITSVYHEYSPNQIAFS
jgi:hypothetical protein